MTMETIATEAQNRFDYWIMNKWNVLPTDQRYLDLTEEQKDFLWENFLIDNPEVKKRIANRFYDPEFDAEWDKLVAEEEANVDTTKDSEPEFDSSDDLNGYSDLESVYKDFLDTRKDLSMPNGLDRVLKQIPKDNVEKDGDWEEVDD